MSLLSDVRVGAQRPRTMRLPPEVASRAAGDEAIELAESVGLVLDDWQRWVLRQALAERSDGRWAAFEVGLVVPRQNGKNYIIAAMELAALFLFDEQLVVHSAHKFDTAQEHFVLMRNLIDGSPDLSAKVLPHLTANGKEAIRLRSGARLKFLARSRGGGRGFSADRVIFDEAYDLPAKAIGAMLPTARARANPQIVYASSAPHFDSTVLHGVRHRGHSQVDDGDRLFYAEWWNDNDSVLDLDAAYAVNPALGIHITDEQLLNEIRSLSAPETMPELKRECFGIPEGGDSEAGAVDWAQWEASKDPPDPTRRYRGSHVADSPRIGLSVSPDGLWSSLSVFGVREDGDFHMGVVDHRQGSGWVVGRAKELHDELGCGVAVCSIDPASALFDQLEGAGVPVSKVSEPEYARAVFNVSEWVKAGRVRHVHQESLNRAVAAAGVRPSGKDLSIWARPGAVDITPLVAGTYAAVGVHSVRPVRGSGVVYA